MSQPRRSCRSEGCQGGHQRRRRGGTGQGLGGGLGQRVDDAAHALVPDQPVDALAVGTVQRRGQRLLDVEPVFAAAFGPDGRHAQAHVAVVRIGAGLLRAGELTGQVGSDEREFGLVRGGGIDVCGRGGAQGECREGAAPPGEAGPDHGSPPSWKMRSLRLSSQAAPRPASSAAAPSSRRGPLTQLRQAACTLPKSVVCAGGR